MKFLAASLALSTASAFDLSKVWAAIPRNGTASKEPVLSTAASCSTANALAKNFVVTITPEKPAAGEQVTTRFEYVRRGGFAGPAP